MNKEGGFTHPTPLPRSLASYLAQGQSAQPEPREGWALHTRQAGRGSVPTSSAASRNRPIQLAEQGEACQEPKGIATPKWSEQAPPALDIPQKRGLVHAQKGQIPGLPLSQG